MDPKTLAGKYEIQGEIARGGMGVMYKAVHTSLGRHVAIKVLHTQFAADPAFRKRFLREARAMARMDYDGIVRVFDVGEEEGSSFIVMEFVEGTDLKHLLLERGRIAPGETLTIAVQAADALAYAHARGVVHRDIKPGNIMIDAGGRVKIADFGIAAASDEISVTTTGQIIGTPEYMSPEQARGGPLDGRSDLYSLGMVLYQMLAGQTPFHGISAMAIVGKLVHDPEEFSLPFAADVPPAFQEIVRSLLRKRADDRLPDAKTLLARLRQVQGGVAAVGSTAATPREQSSTLTFHPAVAGHATGQQGSLPSQMVAPSQSRLMPTRGISEAETDAGSSASAARPTFRAAWLGTRGWIPIGVGAVGVVLLLGTAWWFLAVPRDAPLPLDVSVPAAEADAVSVTELRQLQISVDAVREQLARARAEADAADAGRRAPSPYAEAAEWEARGGEALERSGGLIGQARYQEGRAALVEARDLLVRAQDGMNRARDAAAQSAERERPPPRENPVAARSEPAAQPVKADPAPAPVHAATEPTNPVRTAPARDIPIHPIEEDTTRPPAMQPDPQRADEIRGGKKWYEQFGGVEVPGQ